MACWSASCGSDATTGAGLADFLDVDRETILRLAERGERRTVCALSAPGRVQSTRPRGGAGFYRRVVRLLRRLLR